MFNCVVAAVTAALYLVFAGTPSLSEIGAALFCAALAVIWSFLVQRRARRRFSATGVLYDFVRRAPGLLLTGTWRTSAVLLAVALHGARSQGKALKVEFDPGSRDNGGERTRRALAVLCASLAPDSFVVRLDRGRAALLHSIVPSQDNRDPRLLI